MMIVVVIDFDGPFIRAVIVTLRIGVGMTLLGRVFRGSLGVNMRRPAQFKRNDREILHRKRKRQEPDQCFHLYSRATDPL